ncbi:MAG: hypothetical protein Q9208_007938 [Pyrenodesmia sp. 3 TL-2023]
MVQAFSHIAVPARGTSGIDFPFDLLPLELKKLVLSHILPRHGILPKEPRAQKFNQDEVWYPEETVIFWKYLDKAKKALDAKHVNRTTTADEASVLLPLLLVSKDFTDVARQAFIDTVPLVVSVTPVCLRFLEAVERVCYKYLSYTSFLRFEHFRRMRTFELDLDFAQRWWHDRFKEPLNPNREIWWGEPKEWLRIICDLLSTNGNIRQLTVRFPCLCHLKEDEDPELADQAERIMLNFFSPLRRVKVANRVEFIWSHNMDRLEAINNEPESNKNELTADKDNGEHTPGDAPPNPCGNDTRGGILGRKIRQQFSHLTGESSSRQEATWKRVKAMERYRTGVSTDVRIGWEGLIEELLETVLTRLERCALSPDQSSVAYQRHSAAFERAVNEAVGMILDGVSVRR